LLAKYTQNIETAWTGQPCSNTEELSTYTFLSWIRRSTSSGVARCCTADGKIFILKITEDQEKWESEKQFLQKLGKNKFTIELFQAYQCERFDMYTLVFPYLYTFGQWRKSPSAHEDIKSCMLQLLQILDYCHNIAGILHRDIKQSNILMTQLNPPHPVLADFGCSKWLAVFDDSICGTYRNMPPEWLHVLVDNTPYDIENETAADVWSLGIVFLEVVFNSHKFFDGDSPNVVLQEIGDFIANEIIFATCDQMCPGSSKLLSQMLCINPDSRITAQEGCKHEFFTS